MLEPCDAKVLSTVLRGPGDRKVAWLLGKGPGFCRRKGVGQYGVPFVFLEFRSICLVDGLGKHQEYVRKLIACSPSAAALTSYPRVTLVGSFLLGTGLDKLLPQFFNVLKGEMSLNSRGG